MLRSVDNVRYTARAESLVQNNASVHALTYSKKKKILPHDRVRVVTHNSTPFCKTSKVKHLRPNNEDGVLKMNGGTQRSNKYGTNLLQYFEQLHFVFISFSCCIWVVTFKKQSVLAPGLTHTHLIG